MTTKDKMPKRECGVHPRPGSRNWQWKIKTPDDLRDVYPSEWAHRQSLGTADLSAANLQAVNLRASWLARFEDDRRARRAQPAEKITPEMADVLAQRVAVNVLAGDDLIRKDPAKAQVLGTLLHAVKSAHLSKLTIGGAALPLPEVLSAELDPWDGIPAELLKILSDANAGVDMVAATQKASEKVSAIEARAYAEARQLGFTFDRKTPGARDALLKCLSAYREAWKSVRARDAGEVVPTPPLPTAKSVERTRPTLLDDMRGVWERADPDRKPDTLRKMDQACRLLAEFLKVPSVPMAEVAESQADDFKSWLLGRGVAPKTAKDHLGCIKALFALAKKRKAIPEDPFDGVSIKAPKSTVRESWSMADLKKLFSAPLFTEYAIPRPRTGKDATKAGLDAAYWVPLLCLYTGARVSEVCQLRTVDVLAVESEEDHEATVTVIDITEGEADAAAGTKARRTKTNTSVRRVPVHPDLVALGFLDYVKAIKDAGAGQLFPAVTSREGDPAGKYFSTWFGGLKRGLGFGKWDDLHNMRHTLRTRLAITGLQESAIDTLAGHADGNRGSIGRQVYTHWKQHPQALAREQARLTFPGLNLPRVFTVPVWKP